MAKKDNALPFDSSMSSPVGSLINVPEDEQAAYLDRLFALPEHVREPFISARSGAFLRGLVKTNHLPVEASELVARAVLMIGIGEKTLAHLPSMLSSQLKIPNDKAQTMAQEIEKELFTPIMEDLQTYHAQKQRSDKSIAGKMQPPLPQPSSTSQTESNPTPTPPAPQNLLNLKEDKSRPTPPPMPKSGRNP